MTYIPAFTPVRIRLPYSLLPNILKQQPTSLKFVLIHEIRFCQKKQNFSPNVNGVKQLCFFKLKNQEKNSTITKLLFEQEKFSRKKLSTFQAKFVQFVLKKTIGTLVMNKWNGFSVQNVLFGYTVSVYTCNKKIMKLNFVYVVMNKSLVFYTLPLNFQP